MPGCSTPPSLRFRPRANTRINAPLTISAPTIASEDGPPPRPAGRQIEGARMDLDRYFGKTSATLEEIRRRVMFALDRHPLCRGIEFDVVRMPRNRKNNWTVTLQSIEPDALWEASDIVADIQEAYELAVAA